jgi:cytochrome c biogenesis protein CcmG/thiol:disulfide interchange protein DsbE
MRKAWLLVIIGVLSLLAAFPLAEETSGAEQRPQVGFAAPHFSLKALDGSTYRLEGKRDKPLVVNFWASWCGPCRLEAPDLKKVYEKYKHQVDLYAVNLTKEDDWEAIRRFVQEFELPFPILLDEAGAVADRYFIQAIPTTFFVDKNGVIRHVVLGMVDADTLERQVQTLLAL